MKWEYHPYHVKNNLDQLTSEKDRLKTLLAKATKHEDMRRYLQFVTVPNYCWREEQLIETIEGMVSNELTSS